jgi:hypothetical protein
VLILALQLRGVAGLDGGRVMFHTCWEEELSDTMVASSAGLTKYTRILTLKTTRDGVKTFVAYT